MFLFRVVEVLEGPARLIDSLISFPPSTFIECPPLSFMILIAAVSKIIKSLAKEREFNIISRGEIRKLEAFERKSYLGKYKTISKEASSLMTITDPKPVDVSDYVDHIDYLVEKIGLDHVGISSDFDGGGGIYGWSDASETLNVTAELLKRGYTENEISQLWSDNLLRVLDDVEAISKKLQNLNKV